MLPLFMFPSSIPPVRPMTKIPLPSAYCAIPPDSSWTGVPNWRIHVTEPLDDMRITKGSVTPIFASPGNAPDVSPSIKIVSPATATFSARSPPGVPTCIVQILVPLAEYFTTNASPEPCCVKPSNPPSVHPDT